MKNKSMLALVSLLMSLCFHSQVFAEVRLLVDSETEDMLYQAQQLSQYVNVLNNKPTAVIFEHGLFQGRALVTTENIDDLTKYGFNDITSSILLFNGAKVTVYQHANYQGQSISFSQNADRFGPLNFNDITSSLRFDNP